MVQEIHDFHLWSLSDEKPIFTAHVVVRGNPHFALYTITKLLQLEFNIFHSTLQIEPAKESHFAKRKPGLLPCINEHNFEPEDANSPEKLTPAV